MMRATTMTMTKRRTRRRVKTERKEAATPRSLVSFLFVPCIHTQRSVWLRVASLSLTHTAAPPKKKQKVVSADDGEEAEGDDTAEAEAEVDEEDAEEPEEPEEPEELAGDAEGDAAGDAKDELITKATSKTDAPAVADDSEDVAAGEDNEE